MPSFPGSKRAARRVAATSRASGRDEELDEADTDVENGSGAGSGQERDWELKCFGAGIWMDGSSTPWVLRWRLVMGSSALVRNSFTDLVWLYILFRWNWKSLSSHNSCESELVRAIE
jgi:hypothetical protein